ncbi:hypothetical protein FACS189494_02110 [Spirochaetia bacterium]|nr:hypothetical protein FACS189494_02110 [Spirochaetia bacterium]
MKKFLFVCSVILINLLLVTGCEQGGGGGGGGAGIDVTAEGNTLEGTVSIVGTPNIGNRLTANISALKGDGTITYNWTKSGSSTTISKTATYTIKPADNNSTIKITVSREGYTGTKSATKTIGNPPFEVGGEGPAGGIIILDNTTHIYGNGWDYMEAAPEDLETFEWASEEETTTTIPGTFSDAIGSGKENTELILDADPNAPAALASSEYEHDGFNDWFLPSIEELALIYDNRDDIGGDFANAPYWSSSQNGEYAWYWDFTDGEGYNEGIKDEAYHVRPVRVFAYTPTASPTSTPTSTPTASPTSTPTSTPTASPTSTPTPTPTIPADPHDLIARYGVARASEAFDAVRKSAFGKGQMSEINLGDYIDLEALVFGKYNAIADKVLGTGNPGDSTYHGRLLRLVVVGKNSFSGTNPGAPDHIVFQFQNIPLLESMNSVDKTVGGYASSELYDYLNGDFYTAIKGATGLTDNEIWKPQRKVANAGGTDAKNLVTIADKVWLPTEWEMFGSRTNSTLLEEAKNQARLDYYADNTKRMKYKSDNTAFSYWLASLTSDDPALRFCGVTGNGAPVTASPITEFGVAPAFCLY